MESQHRHQQLLLCFHALHFTRTLEDLSNVVVLGSKADAYTEAPSRIPDRVLEVG